MIELTDYTRKIRVPRVEKHWGYYHIPPLTPHWECWIGEYETYEEAEDARQGLIRTINSPSWKMHMLDMEEEVEETWLRLENLFQQRG